MQGWPSMGWNTPDGPQVLYTEGTKTFYLPFPNQEKDINIWIISDLKVLPMPYNLDPVPTLESCQAHIPGLQTPWSQSQRVSKYVPWTTCIWNSWGGC